MLLSLHLKSSLVYNVRYDYSVTTFIPTIYNYIPETNHISMVYCFSAVLLLQFMVHVMLFPILNALYFTLLLSVVFAQYPTWLFCVIP